MEVNLTEHVAHSPIKPASLTSAALFLRHVCMGMVWTEARGQFSGAGSLLPPAGD